MKQVVQNMKTGEIMLIDVPCPEVKENHVLVRTLRSLISPGTERMLMSFGKSNWITRAKNHPDKVRQVLDKIKTDGLNAAWKAVKDKLDKPLPLGYSNVGYVIGIGEGVSGLKIGDRVVSNGPHSECVNVPFNLTAKVPDNVSDDEAVFTVLAAIALQGIRLANPSIGENVVVIGLGLIGLLAVQLLKINGCRVLGLDLDSNRVELAKKFNINAIKISTEVDPVAEAMRFSNGRGVDAVIITASTKSSTPVHHAAQMLRKRGKIILVGVTGLKLSRADFYEKELTFQVSCSYGPGRYDPLYEGKGCDYPFEFVRWTAKRNFEAVLSFLSDKMLNVSPLISHRFSIYQVEKAYNILEKNRDALGIIIEYPKKGLQITKAEKTIILKNSNINVLTKERVDNYKKDPGKLSVAFIGSGQFASSTLIPLFSKMSVKLKTIVSEIGMSASYIGDKFGFEEATTDVHRVLEDPSVDIVVIATRHDTHGRFVFESLKAGKNVFVEKPLCLTLDELKNIKNIWSKFPENNKPVLMVGFNRRFAPLTKKVKELIEGVKPKNLIMTVNAGALPRDHWIKDEKIGGGRIVGEACHFIDLLRYLVGYPVVGFQVGKSKYIHGRGGNESNVVIVLRFEDGSLGTIHYITNGHKSFPKERLEIFFEDKVLQINNFRQVKKYGWPSLYRISFKQKQDKGHENCIKAFIDSVRNKKRSPIPFDEIVEVSKLSIMIENSESNWNEFSL